MRIPFYVLRAVQAASKSWPETARMCLLLLFLAAAGAMFLAVLLVTLPLVYGSTGMPAVNVIR